MSLQMAHRINPDSSLGHKPLPTSPCQGRSWWFSSPPDKGELEGVLSQFRLMDYLGSLESNLHGFAQAFLQLSANPGLLELRQIFDKYLAM